MGIATADRRTPAFWTRLAGAAALACVTAAIPPIVSLHAQTLGTPGPSDGEMLLEADTLVFDQDSNTVTAIGGVRIDYDGSRLVAQKVSYDRTSKQLRASGNVQIVDADGNTTFSDEIVLSDDFRDGFVNALRIETADKTYFAAESAERREGDLTTFNNGVYTACEPCEDKPGKPPIWRIKSKTIIWDGKAKTIRFKNARFELFGLPIAYLPVLEIPDQTVKRKTGFLIPGIQSKSGLGIGVTAPFYIALSPTYDLTLKGTYYSKQGFLGEAEWRQRFNNGQYSLKIAGIDQQNPSEISGEVDKSVTWRGMVGTKGDFTINPRWAFGWDLLAQSDKNFARRYGIGGYDDYVRQSEIYLTGINDRNLFDLHAYHFDIQESPGDSRRSARDQYQPWVLPSLDYHYTPDDPLAGGELNFNVNTQGIYRSELSSTSIPAGSTNVVGIPGPEGKSGRITAEAEWKRTFITDGGLVITPLLQARGDAIYSDLSAASRTAIASLTVPNDIRAEYYRYMATAGLEMRWPILFSTTSSTHVLEPMAQIFVRPNEPYAATVGIPNEDAQSLVFDATSLFERDKFSGYDRIEGGTRANVGLRYSGSYDNGWTTSALFGQSYHLGGVNSFATPDLVNAGAFSGLETDVSDYVAMIGLNVPRFASFTAGARLDEKSFDLRRMNVAATTKIGALSLRARYAFIEAQPLYGFDVDRQEVALTASAKINENWRAFAAGTYDLESNALIQNAYGFAYDDECFSYSLTYSRSRNVNAIPETKSSSIGFNVSFRTIGEFGTRSSNF